MIQALFGLIVLLTLPLGSAAGDSLSADSLYRWYLDHYPFYSIPDTVYTFDSEYGLPEGYRHPDSDELTPFQNWIANFPLWPYGKPVGHWKGKKLYDANDISRVVHLPWRGRSFRDRAIPWRLLGEYLHYQKRESDLEIVPELGNTISYSDWLQGIPRQTAAGARFIDTTEARASSVEEYYRFIAYCMRNSSYGTLVKNCRPIPPEEARPGDLLLITDEQGRTGQAYVLMHMLIARGKKSLFVLATGCPDACDFHIPLVNEDRDDPWLTLEEIDRRFLNRGSIAGFFRFHVE